jgi:hypothetical protein
VNVRENYRLRRSIDPEKSHTSFSTTTDTIPPLRHSKNTQCLCVFPRPATTFALFGITAITYTGHNYKVTACVYFFAFFGGLGHPFDRRTGALRLITGMTLHSFATLR